MSHKAMGWALELPWPMGDRPMKLKWTLACVADYAHVETDAAFPSQRELAAKSSQSIGSVKRRLDELCEIGLITRYPRWQRKDGVILKSPETGARQTSDEFQFDLTITAEEFLAKYARWKDVAGSHADEGEDTPPSNMGGEGESGVQGDGESQLGGGRGVSPDSPRGVTADSPRSGYKEPLESPPSPPPGGTREGTASPGREDEDPELESAVAVFVELAVEPITDMPKLRNVLRAMPPDKRRDAVLGWRGYCSFVKAERDKGRNRTAKQAHLFVGGGLYEGYIAQGKAAVASAAMVAIAADSEQHRAWKAFAAIARARLAEPVGGQVRVPTEWPVFGRGWPDWLAPGPGRVFVEEGSNAWWAWYKFCREHGGLGPAPLLGLKENAGKRGRLFPGEFPPAKARQFENFPGPDEMAELLLEGARDESASGDRDADLNPVEGD